MSPDKVSTSSIYIVACIKISFSFEAEKYSIVSSYYVLLIHSSVDGHLGASLTLTIVENAVNMDAKCLFCLQLSRV